jgi:hypothetical protein
MTFSSPSNVCNMKMNEFSILLLKIDIGRQVNTNNNIGIIYYAAL